MKSHIEVMYDPRYHDQRSLFERIVYDIQNQHFAWFEHRINPVTNESPDKIYNYYRYCWDSDHNIKLWIHPELDPDIAESCVNAFKKIFRTAT